MTQALRDIRRWPWHLPAHVLNGIGVALGVLLVQLLAGAAGGTPAALLAAGGAIFASLADTPNPPHRTGPRVALGAAVGLMASILVTLLRAHPLALGVLLVAMSFCASMLLAWGVRAGPISFVPILAVVFTMAAPPPADWQTQAVHAAWTALGGALYLAWALLVARWLQPRYRALALAGVLHATAELFRSRARMLALEPREAQGALPLQDWMQRQVALDERLQGARDMLFVAADAPHGARQIALLLHAIDLRDILLGSELDLDLLGGDAAAERLRIALAGRIDGTAAMLDRVALAVQLDVPLARVPGGATVPDALDASIEGFAADPRRRALAGALRDRARHLSDDLARMLATLQHHAAPAVLRPAELQFFVSPQGWPLAALRPHLRLGSPILRHALRSAVALGTAYFLALALPWTSHPHWLVLSVAVVLRGNLDQTLSRRDARVAGTVLGCMLVLLFASLQQYWLSGIVFLLAVGIAHAFVNVRYLVTATAATVMALLQAHMAHPAGGFNIGERLADTLLGALLAWGFCYVLPAWERRGLVRLVDRVRTAARALVHETLHWPEPGQADVPLRLARREFYEAIGGIAASAQRSRAEPARVQIALPAMATLLTRCHVLLAQLAAVRTLLERRRDRLEPEAARALLLQAATAVDRLLEPGSAVASDAVASDTLGPAPMVWIEEPERLLPWLERRLGLVADSAAGVAAAASAVRAASVRG
ncbi:FUSC family membrane protein [Pseudorhodoferax sp. Leaf267]|uniref:FUSC family protein n=1 Tax=Pseudorhodoferax sp. Leaf267 TaxID=1736316 RepID=UPI0006F35695|nr:FUSC family membrane protein [Pseudorhodoferax sp. Leaf267]KQP14179.1 hypothetical protein ASF43_15210 [Pseudorhodoferax sp. Leaf267]